MLNQTKYKKMENYLKVPAELADNFLSESVKLITELTDLVCRMEIRRTFDRGLLDTNMLAAIQVAKDKGYHDLAKEMMSDMEEMEVSNA